MGYNEGEVRQSEWNSASFKMKRLHELSEKLNILNQSPLATDDITGEPYYILILRCCDSLYQEVQASLDDGRRKRAEEFRKVLVEFIEKNPVKIMLKNDGRPTGQVKLKRENWARIQEGLWLYEKMVREYVLKVGMDTAEDSDFGGFD